MRNPTARTPMVLAAGLVGLLAVLAGLQWRWIGGWGTVEEVRLASALRAGAADLDRDLTGHLLRLGSAFEDLRASDTTAGDTLAARLAAWQADVETPALVASVFWVRPGPDPTLAVLDAGGLRPVDWPGDLAPWRDVASSFPARLTPAPGSEVARLTIDDARLPAAPPGVLVPVLPPPSGDLRLVLLALDGDVLAAELLPALLSEHLVGDDLFDVRLVAADDRSVRLFDTAPEAGPFETPDLDVGVGPGEVRELAVAVAAPAPGAVALDLREETEQAAVEAPDARPTRWRLVAQHRAGSIAAAVSGLRRRQLGLAFGVLAVLAAAVGLLVASVRRERGLAARQLAFVAGVSHELRTPLAVLRSAGENLADGVVGEDGTRRYGTLVRDESQRLAEMVETVLTYAGADAATPRRVRTPVADVVAEALAQARPVLDEVGATVDLALDAHAPALDADAAAVATALRNLIGNAARHGGPRIRIASTPAALDGAPAVALAVTDDGPGFDADADLFEPFVRGARAVAAQTPGSGLGLALVRRVAEAHGGTVAAGASASGGARVTLTLPAAP